MPFSVIDELQESDEWRAIRRDLAACYRLVHKFRMTDLIYNHITARLPGAGHSFLINAFGLHYSEITASSLYEIDLEGNILSKPDLPYGINPAGFVIHSAIHAARPDVQCVIHTHSRAGSAVSAMKDGLLPISQTALRFYGRVGYHDFEGPVLHNDERERLVASLGNKDALILRNHGLLVVGRSIPEAFHSMQRLESACQIQVDALASGVELTYPSTKVCEATVEVLAGRNGEKLPASGRLEWAALLRDLQRTDPDYID